MAWKSTSDRYGLVAIFIHWLAALMIIGMVVIGIMAAESTDPERTAALLRLHAPLGLAILALTLARMLWWLAVDRKPAEAPGQKPWQAALARWVHRLFYVVILAMVASGMWLMDSSGGGPVIFAEGGPPAGVSDQPAGGPKPPAGTQSPAAAPDAAAPIALPDFESFPAFAGALYHQFVRKDRLLARMGIGAKKSGPVPTSPSVTRS
jgi:cytochrome b561